MVFIRHYAVEAQLISEGVLFMVLVVKNMCLLRVKKGIREPQTPRIVLLQIGVADMSIGLFRKPENLHRIFHGLALLQI